MLEFSGRGILLDIEGTTSSVSFVEEKGRYKAMLIGYDNLSFPAP